MGRQVRNDPATLPLVNGAFIDVVAEEDHGVRQLGGEVSMGGVVAGAPGLAGCRSDVEAVDRFSWARRSSRSPGRAHPPFAPEPIPVLAARAETVDDHVDRMSMLR